MSSETAVASSQSISQLPTFRRLKYLSAMLWQRLHLPHIELVVLLVVGFVDDGHAADGGQADVNPAVQLITPPPPQLVTATLPRYLE